MWWVRPFIVVSSREELKLEGIKLPLLILSKLWKGDLSVIQADSQTFLIFMNCFRKVNDLPISLLLFLLNLTLLKLIKLYIFIYLSYERGGWEWQRECAEWHHHCHPRNLLSRIQANFYKYYKKNRLLRSKNINTLSQKDWWVVVILEIFYKGSIVIVIPENYSTVIPENHPIVIPNLIGDPDQIFISI